MGIDESGHDQTANYCSLDSRYDRPRGKKDRRETKNNQKARD
jgi:hypothetical protein